MFKKNRALQVSLIVAGALLLSATSQAETITLRWTHPDVVDEEIVGFRLYQRALNSSWGAPVEIPLTQITPNAQGIYHYDVEVDPGEIVLFATSAYTAESESFKSNERKIIPNIPIPDPGPGKLISYSFDGAQGEPAGWFDTGPNNGLFESPDLFRTGTVGSDGVFMTQSSATNVHSHAVVGPLDEWIDYEYTGRMRKSSGDGGVGVTFYSQYPHSDTYFRLRSISSENAFHIANHGADGMTCSSSSTGVIPAAGQWYAFRIRVETLSTQTRVRARVWQDGASEPGSWQVDCQDSTAARLTSGTVGVWSMATGEKYWDDLDVALLSPEPQGTRPPPPVLIPSN